MDANATVRFVRRTTTFPRKMGRDSAIGGVTECQSRRVNDGLAPTFEPYDRHSRFVVPHRRVGRDDVQLSGRDDDGRRFDHVEQRKHHRGRFEGHDRESRVQQQVSACLSPIGAFVDQDDDRGKTLLITGASTAARFMTTVCENAPHGRIRHAGDRRRLANDGDWVGRLTRNTATVGRS